MNIVIDIRPLMGGNVSGIETYIHHLLEELFQLDEDNTYLLFANSTRPEKWLSSFQQKNVFIVHTRIPNKVLNICLRFLRWPKLDQLVLSHLHSDGQKPPKDLDHIDLFFMPDLRLTALGKGVKKITVIHDLSFHHFPHFFSRKTRLWHRLLKAEKEIHESDQLIAVSNFTKQDVIKTYSINPEKIEVIEEGITKNFGDNVTSEDIEKIKKIYRLPERYLLFLSTLEPRKNIDRLIEGFNLYQKDHPEVTMALVIAGKTNSKIFSAVKIKNNPEIIFPGFIEEQDKAALLKGATAFIYPSLWEGFGLPLVEAMKCGVPIITSNCASMPEITGESAILIDPLKPASIAEAINQIMDPKVQNRLKAKMAEQIKKFSWQQCAQKTLQIMTKMYKEK